MNALSALSAYHNYNLFVTVNLCTKCVFRSCKVTVSKDRTQLSLENKDEGTRLVTPSTGIGRGRTIDKMFSSSGRLALLMEGRVYVYSLGTNNP